jgi:hypothetical protein
LLNCRPQAFPRRPRIPVGCCPSMQGLMAARFSLTIRLGQHGSRISI